MSLMILWGILIVAVGKNSCRYTSNLRGCRMAAPVTPKGGSVLLAGVGPFYMPISSSMFESVSFMFLQPDSELHIIPAEGGESRRMRCNTARMNSWHSWSPNSRWLVFTSKAHSPFTQLFLTHIDHMGRSSPPVILTHMSAPDWAANIPEFVNTDSDAIKDIIMRF